MMGESTAGLVRSFSQPSLTRHETKEGHLVRALTSSISFGRYMSEALAWEKYSAFTHNRYMEELEKCSKPGSVAEMKAYFEAHYKRKASERATTLLEQKISSANSTSKLNRRTEIENDTTMDQDSGGENTHVTAVKTQGDEGRELEDSEIEEAQRPNLVENRIAILNKLENVEDGSINISTEQNKTHIKGAATSRGSASSDKKRKAISSTKSRGCSGVPKTETPLKPTLSLQKKKSMNASPNFQTTVLDSSNRKRTPSKSLDMSMKFGSRETKKPLSPVLQKIVSSRHAITLARASKDNATQETSSRAAVDILKHPVNPRRWKSRSQASLDLVISEIGDVERKSRFPCIGSSKSPRASGGKERCPIESFAFSFKSEERAAKRKEFLARLEQKLKAKETEKEQHKAKSKERARNDYKDLHQPATSNFKPHYKFSHETKTSNDHPIKKVPPTRPCSLNLGRKTTSKVQDKNYRPPWRLTSRTNTAITL